MHDADDFEFSNQMHLAGTEILDETQPRSKLKQSLIQKKMLPDVMGFGRQTSRIIFCILQDLFEYKIKRNQKILSSNFFFYIILTRL